RELRAVRTRSPRTCEAPPVRFSDRPGSRRPQSFRTILSRSWLHILQYGLQLLEPLGPEQPIAVHPIDERREPLRLGAVIGKAPFTAFADEPCAAQSGEVLGNGGLGDRKAGLELRDAHFPTTQALEDRAACRVGKSPENVGFNHDGNISRYLFDNKPMSAPPKGFRRLFL